MDLIITVLLVHGVLRGEPKSPSPWLIPRSAWLGEQEF